MRKTLTLGTARITIQPNHWLVEYMNSGSFLVGERTYSTLNDAEKFCRERELKVIEIVSFPLNSLR